MLTLRHCGQAFYGGRAKPRPAALGHGALHRIHGFAGKITLTVPLATLLGLAAGPARSPAWDLSTLTWPATWRAPPASVTTGTRPGGHDPGVKLRHLTQIRHATCTGPGCRRPAVQCDFEHNIPYEAGGGTCLCNGGPLCKC